MGWSLLFVFTYLILIPFAPSLHGVSLSFYFPFWFAFAFIVALCIWIMHFQVNGTLWYKLNKKGGNISPSYCYSSLHISLFRKNLHCEFLSLCPLFPPPSSCQVGRRQVGAQ